MNRLIFLFFAMVFLTQSLYAQMIDVYKWPKQVERSHDYNAIHYRLKYQFDLEKKNYTGENTITLRALRSGFEKCILDAEEMTVTSVVDERYIPLKYEQTDKSLIVYFSRPCSYGDTLFFTVKFQGKDPKSGLFFIDETPRNPKLMGTSSFPDKAHHWFPCYDYPHDKVTDEIIATVESKYKVISNGRLVSITEDRVNGMTTYHWSQDLPHSTYLFMLTAGPFEILRDSCGSIPISHWVYKKDVEAARQVFKNTPKMIDFFNKQFGFPYPWAKCDHVTVPYIGGGAETTSATSLGQDIPYQERGEQVVAHELAHQWWGDMITLRTWSETWLNEGFGTYGDYLYIRYSRGEEEGAIDLLGKKNGYLREAHTKYIRPIVFDQYNKPGDLFDGHTYPKAANVIHMLRFILGDDLFFRTIQFFLQKHAFQPVETKDFMNAVKDVTGQNLDWFFKQWLYKPGHPEFNVSYTWDAGTEKLKLKVLQTQDASKGIPVYTMPVIIGILTPDKKQSQKVWIREREETFEFDVKEKPLLVRFDEGDFLLKELTFNKSAEELLYQLVNDDVIGRMWAAKELLRYKDSSGAVVKLKEAAGNDPCWAVRGAAIEVLGEMLRQEDITFLKERSEDRNPKVRVAAIKVLGEYRNAELVEFFKERFAREDNFVNQGEAIRSIGKCGDSTVIPFLEELKTRNSPMDTIRKAAEWALGEIGKR